MKVVYLTAGAAGMYCGSCMRDNTLVAAMRGQGHDALLLPLYTPIRTDEPDVSELRVFFGGINVYLQQSSALFRHTPWFVDRWFDAPSLLRGMGRWAHRSKPEDLGRLTVSMLKGPDGPIRKEVCKLLRELERLQPDLVNFPNAMFVGLAPAIRRSLGAKTVCTLTGEDIFLDKLTDPYRSEALALIRRQAPELDAFVAVSEYYGAYCQEHFAVPPARLKVIPLGIRLENDVVPAEKGDAGAPFTIGYLARVCPDKGLHILCEAFAALSRSGRACRLRVAGYLPSSEREYLDGLKTRLTEQGLGLEYVGEVDRAGKLSFLRSLNVLSVPTAYRESKGIYVLEALAQGVPVVEPNHGAFPEIIGATGGGVLCQPEDPQSLADAIAGLIDDPERARRLGRQGKESICQSFTDQIMAQRTWAFYESLTPPHIL